MEVSDDAIEVSDDVSEEIGMDDRRSSAGAPLPVKQRESLSTQQNTPQAGARIFWLWR